VLTCSLNITGPSRTASTAKPIDRLQERLARAIAARSTTPTGTKPDSGSQPAPDSIQSSPRRSVDTTGRSSIESSGAAQSAPIHADTADSHEEAPSPADAVDTKSQEAADTAETEGKDNEERMVGVNGVSELGDAPFVQAGNAGVTNGEVADEVTQRSANATTTHETTNAATDASQVADVKMKALEQVVLQHQEETHGYVEQIDALQAKLQYLSREASESARKAAQAAPAGSLEKKLAEKDQQIAQLLEEGKVLAATEQKHRTIIKKLRGRITEMEKESTDAHISRAKIDTEVDALRRKAKRTDELEKSSDDMQRRLDQAQRELSTAKAENSQKTTQISELQIQLRRLTQQAEALATKVNDEARDQDRKRITELEESVAALQVEKNLVADRGKQQIDDWKEKAEMATERARILELELKAELQAMESKLEASRVRAEEASSGAVGDSQAKLMRQVETLQSQYSIASDNWQGIEATLLARVANLEKERDEAQQRESEMRKKAREAVSAGHFFSVKDLRMDADELLRRYERRGQRKSWKRAKKNSLNIKTNLSLNKHNSISCGSKQKMHRLHCKRSKRSMTKNGKRGKPEWQSDKLPNRRSGAAGSTTYQAITSRAAAGPSLQQFHRGR
jgi:TATA element modulatory factor